MEHERNLITALATTVVLVIVAGVLAVVFRSSDSPMPLTNSALVSLIHSASSATEKAPASTFRMTMTISAQGQHQAIEMSGITVKKTHASTFEMRGAGVDEGIISVDGIGYSQVPEASVELNHGKRWLAVPAIKPTGELKQLAGSGPASILKALATVGGTINDEGTQDVQGVSTTEYSFHADLLRVFGPLYKKLFGNHTASILKQLGFDNLPMKIWVDADGMVRELELSFAFHGVSTEEVAYLTPSNSIPEITAPPASEVRMVKSVRQYGHLVSKFVIAAQASQHAS